MNISQLHERLRLEMLRRIDSGRFTSIDLARLSGFTPSHISNFLNQKRKLGTEGLDRILRSQGLSVTDLDPAGRRSSTSVERAGVGTDSDSVPLVQPMVAAESARIHSESILDVVRVNSAVLMDLRDKCSAERRRWDRFVAVKIDEEEARFMQGALPENGVLLIDRHYNSASRYTPGKPTVYAVRLHHRLKFRYADIVASHLVLRAHDVAHVPELIPLSARQPSTDLIVGRAFFSLAPL